jgi:hypothetical protein
MNCGHSVMFDSCIVAYVQYVIILIDLQKVVSQGLKCLSLTRFIAFGINIWFRNLGILYIQYICILQVRTSTNCVITLHRIRHVNPFTPKKYTLLIGSSAFVLRDTFQGSVPGVKLDLPVYITF